MSRPTPPGLSRRAFLSRSARAGGWLALSVLGQTIALPGRASGVRDVGPLQPPDASGLRLPEGFRSRVVAITGRPVGAGTYPWHARPDGGATYAAPDGGWVYVSNSEQFWGGGVGAIRFDADGAIREAYPILTDTCLNCAGGPTPWNTWLSCEEVDWGRVFECDPLAPGSQGQARPALGIFRHEAAAVDPVHRCLYLTEDQRDGLLYRFTPSRYPDLSEGGLAAAEIRGTGALSAIRPGEKRPVVWHDLPNPQPVAGGAQNPAFYPAEERATRYQLDAPTRFARGEGCWYANGSLYFATTADSRVWKLDTVAQTLELVYDLARSRPPELQDPDNVFAAPNGDLYVAEDAGDLQIVALTPSGQARPFAQLTGRTGTEITGPALSPDGRRMYFSEQHNPGTTFEVTGPFL